MPFEPTIAGTQAPPPYDGTNVKVFAMPLAADFAPLQAVCNQYLSIASPASGITFEPFGSAGICTVVLEVLHYPALRVPTPPWDDFGSTEQCELLFSIPVVRKQAGVIVEYGIFIPYIFVDDPGSAFSGREVLGLPKVLASFAVNRNFPASDPLKMSFAGRIKVGGPIQIRDLVKVTPIPGLVLPPLLPTLTTVSMLGFSSRVFINPQNLAADSYQSIMRCTYTSTGGFLSNLPPVRVDIMPLLHLDIQATLGLRTNAAGQIVSNFPYSLTSDFKLDGVTTLWET
jgi:hypothetical protein